MGCISHVLSTEVAAVTATWILLPVDLVDHGHFG